MHFQTWSIMWLTHSSTAGPYFLLRSACPSTGRTWHSTWVLTHISTGMSWRRAVMLMKSVMRWVCTGRAGNLPVPLADNGAYSFWSCSFVLLGPPAVAKWQESYTAGASGGSGEYFSSCWDSSATDWDGSLWWPALMCGRICFIHWYFCSGHLDTTPRPRVSNFVAGMILFTLLF